MVDFDYLYQGLCGLARAHRANAMAGHLGAALVAGYFFGEEHPDLPEEVFSAIENDLNQIKQGAEPIWYNQSKTGITVPELFAPFPQEAPSTTAADDIAAALTKNIGQTRQSGHNVIFSSLALRAFRDHPEAAAPSLVQGIVQLIHGFDGAVPGRGYYGKETGWLSGEKVQLTAADDFPAYRSLNDMVQTVIDRLIDSAAVRKQGFGGLFHIINHAAGLVQLSQYGFGDLAERGLAAHHQHLRLWRSLPDVSAELGPLVKADHDPRTAAYWKAGDSAQWSARLTHRIKTLFGFHTILPMIDDAAKRKQAEENFLYLMA